MLCQMTCVGYLYDEPKRRYYREQEISYFQLLVKRDDNSNKYDLLAFEAWTHIANYVNVYFHKGDCISVISRPIRKYFKKKDGTKCDHVLFRVKNVSFICHRSKLLINQFGGNDFPEISDIRYDLL